MRIRVQAMRVKLTWRGTGVTDEFELHCHDRETGVIGAFGRTRHHVLAGQHGRKHGLPVEYKEVLGGLVYLTGRPVCRVDELPATEAD
jgi:hypothetical protein